jgi:hypothetical protein
VVPRRPAAAIAHVLDWNGQVPEGAEEAARRAANRFVLEATGREAGASGTVAATVETMSKESDTQVTVMI